jgi:hypothetical protein
MGRVHMGRIRETDGNGEYLSYNEKWLEESMKPYLTLRHTIDEARKRKRKTGYIIYARQSDYNDIPFISYTFSRWEDATFIIEMLESQIPNMKRLGLYTKMVRWKEQKENPTWRNPITLTKYQVEKLDENARKHILRHFVI